MNVKHLHLCFSCFMDNFALKTNDMRNTLILLVALSFLLTSALYSQEYKNPVLPGFHSDPSVCRVNDDFYLVNSTFQYFPAVPIFHSKDLIHWEQIGACLTRPSQVNLDNADGNSGIYAPTIRYHDGIFYMVTTQYPSRKHFYVYAKDPSGPWSDPVFIDFTTGSCDPTLFFDEGKCYFLWKDVYIKICEIDVKSGRQMSPIKRLWSGMGGRYPEGPHLYKKDGYYYLLIAEGGTEHGHHITIARSRYLEGPYEPCPFNPILSHFNNEMQNSPIQGLGHADLVQAKDGSWWMICLGYRTSGYLQHVIGRETFLAPVEWDKNAWPVVNGNGTLQLDMKCRTLPQIEMVEESGRDDFDKRKLGWQWNYICVPKIENYSLDVRKGYLRMIPSAITIDHLGSPTFIGRRQTELKFSATASIDVSHLQNGTEVGITAYAARLNHYDVKIIRKEGRSYVQGSIRIGQMKHVEREVALDKSVVYVRIESDKEYYYLSFSLDNKIFTLLAKMEYRYLSTETIGGFTGVYLGLFAQTDKKTSAYTDVDWFDYRTFE